MPLTLEDQRVFRELEKRCPMVTSDANFTNLFIWQGFYHFSWTMAHDCICILARPEGAPEFGLPPLGCGDRVRAAEFLLEELSEPLLSRVPEELAAKIGAAHPEWRIQADPDNDDYIYLAEKLINLNGRRMHQKKNHYNYFIQNYHFDLLPVEECLKEELLAVESKWLTSKSENIEPGLHLLLEEQAVHLLLENYSALGVQGLAIKIDGKIEAFSLGESLNDDTAIIHVEKGNPEIRGIYVAICSHFCKRYYSDKTYINREQDLGLPGLRKSKESLKPDHMGKKFNISPQ
jgi:hypothetical protein